MKRLRNDEDKKVSLLVFVPDSNTKLQANDFVDLGRTIDRSGVILKICEMF